MDILFIHDLRQIVVKGILVNRLCHSINKKTIEITITVSEEISEYFYQP